MIIKARWKILCRIQLKLFRIQQTIMLTRILIKVNLKVGIQLQAIHKTVMEHIGEGITSFSSEIIILLIVVNYNLSSSILICYIVKQCEESISFYCGHLIVAKESS
jgi:hypothetical protein